MSGSPGDGGDPGDPDGGHLGKATFCAREVTWESQPSGCGGCVDIDIAIMLRDETRKVQKSMYELFAKQSDVLAELQKQISSIAHQQVTAAWQKCMQAITRKNTYQNPCFSSMELVCIVPMELGVGRVNSRGSQVPCVLSWKFKEINQSMEIERTWWSCWHNCY